MPITVRPGGSMQAAVDAAPRRTTISRAAGVYHESSSGPNAVTITIRRSPGHPKRHFL